LTLIINIFFQAAIMDDWMASEATPGTLFSYIQEPAKSVHPHTHTQRVNYNLPVKKQIETRFWNILQNLNSKQQCKTKQPIPKFGD
jgi:hypothetical protein